MDKKRRFMDSICIYGQEMHFYLFMDKKCIYGQEMSIYGPEMHFMDEKCIFMDKKKYQPTTTLHQQTRRF